MTYSAADAAMDLKRYVASINLTSVQNLDNRFDNASAYASAAWWESAPVLLLALLYVLIICGGVFGNASLLLTICTQTSARFRNPLLVALCVADLMVAGVAAPLTLLALLTVQQRWSLSALECKSVYFMQVRFACVRCVCERVRIIRNGYLLLAMNHNGYCGVGLLFVCVCESARVWF